MFKGALIPAMVERLATLKDGSVNITISTQELSPAKAAELFELRGKLATVYISPADISRQEMTVIDSVEPDLQRKTPSQRMRAVMYIIWKQTPEGYKDFAQYYEAKMNAYIEGLKQNIQD